MLYLYIDIQMKSVVLDVFFLKNLKKRNIFPIDFQALADINLDLISGKVGFKLAAK